MNTINRTNVRPAARSVQQEQGAAAIPPGQPLQMQPPQSQPQPALQSPLQPPYGINPTPGGRGGESGKTMRDLLEESVGHYIIAEHLVGVSQLVSKAGVLARVESNCYVLRDAQTMIDTVCDYFSLKFFRRLPYNTKPGLYSMDSQTPTYDWLNG